MSSINCLTFCTPCADGGGKNQPKKKKPSAEPKSKRNVEPENSVTGLDFRVGLIEKAQKHYDGDSLYVEEIHLGGGETRTVVSRLHLRRCR